MKRRFFRSAIAALPAACVPTNPGFAKPMPPLLTLDPVRGVLPVDPYERFIKKITLNSVYGKFGRSFEDVMRDRESEAACIAALGLGGDQ